MELLLLVGPTAVGKTEVSLLLAESMGGELVSCDSRQLYAELNIGTAKPTPEELLRVRHHFIGEATIQDPWSAGRYGRAAEERLQSLAGAGRNPIVVGGSTLYIQALYSGLADIPRTDPGVRISLNEKLDQMGPQALFKVLQEVDPDFAATLDPTKSQRILRGLEVYASTGRPLSSFFGEFRPPSFGYRVVVLDRARPELYERIDQRVDSMVAAGLLGEVHGLLEAGFDAEANPLKTIGYTEMAGFIRGDHSLDEAVRLIKRNSRRYAKRQLTWFRGQLPQATWILIAPDDSAVDVADRIASALAGPG